MLTEDYITEVYCFIDDMMKECWKNIRKRGPGPKLSDAEVITMEIAGESLGMDCDKTIHCGWPRKLDNLTWCKMPVKLT